MGSSAQRTFPFLPIAWQPLVREGRVWVGDFKQMKESDAAPGWAKGIFLFVLLTLIGSVVYQHHQQPLPLP